MPDPTQRLPAAPKVAAQAGRPNGGKASGSAGLRDQAAKVLDETLSAAAQRYGLHTDSARWVLAFWLDGRRVRTSYVRKLIGYLRMIALHAR